MRTVCSTLGVARSHIAALRARRANWVDRRTARHSKDDSALLEEIREVVRDRGTYGYRRVWGVLKH
jgi:putative transposase